jgi:hypothetical protein
MSLFNQMWLPVAILSMTLFLTNSLSFLACSMSSLSSSSSISSLYSLAAPSPQFVAQQS